MLFNVVFPSERMLRKDEVCHADEIRMSPGLSVRNPRFTTQFGINISPDAPWTRVTQHNLHFRLLTVRQRARKFGVQFNPIIYPTARRENIWRA